MNKTPLGYPTLQNLVVDLDAERGVTGFTAYAPPGHKSESYELLRLALPYVEALDRAIKAKNSHREVT